MPNVFNSVKLQRPKRNVFDLSHDVKMSLNMGELVPTMVMECVPGDSFQIGCEALVRLAPLVAPMMHRVDVYQHYFFVPYRILWDNWEKFITNTKVAGAVPAFPYIEYSSGTPFSQLLDYLGVPTPAGAFSLHDINAMPSAAYNAIIQEYYLDQNLMAPVEYKLVDGDNSANLDLFQLQYRCWEHDYFTSALPFAQKGDAVSIPLLGDAPIKGYDPAFPGPGFYGLAPAGGGALNLNVAIEHSPTVPDHELYADLGAANVTTINDLRLAFALQSWLERNALGGTRYTENIFAHFGVKSSDQRLQRPEYITGTRNPIVISEVLNTTGTDDAPQGNMAGHGVGVTQGKYGKYFCEEHGLIMGLMSIMPKTAYQDGLPRLFNKITDFTQYYWPKFANLGEQEVLNSEVFANGEFGDQVFGYQSRYSEYKHQPNRVAGEFRTTLDHWHMGRKFATAPSLNDEFVKCIPTNRVFAVTDPAVDHIYAQVLHRIKAIRPMPKYGTPSQI